MSRPIFISYARRASLEVAAALHRALGGDAGQSFFDSTDIPPGASIPDGVFESLLAARVVVVFADATYFERPYCLEEFDITMFAFETLMDEQGSEEAKREALLPVLIAISGDGATPVELDRFPPELASTNWIGAQRTQALASLVNERLMQVTRSFGDRLDALGRLPEVRFRKRDLGLPAPKRLPESRSFLYGMPDSIGRNFVGRAEDLWRLHKALSTNRGGSAGLGLTIALEGGAGFGKTRLAAEYVHRFGSDHYTGGLVWMNAEASAEGLEEQHYRILRMLSSDSNPLPDLKAFRESGRDTAAELGAALQSLSPTSPVLYVVDSVPEPSPGEPPRTLDVYCPAISAVSLLVTSRATQSFVGGIQSLSVDVLPVSAGVALLTRGVRRPALAETEWVEIAGWVGCLPLALELLRASIAGGTVSPNRLLSEARSASPSGKLDEQWEALKPLTPLGVIRGVNDAFSSSYQHLPADGARLALLLAELASDPIPVALLDALGDLAPETARGLLRARSFVMANAGDGVAMYGRMHRVLADYLRRIIDEETCIVTVLHAIKSQMNEEACADPDQWPLMNAYRPHVEWLLSQELSLPERRDREAAAELSLALITLASGQGLAELEHKTSESTLRYSLEYLGEDHPLTIKTMVAHAMSFIDVGDLLAAEHAARKAVATSQRVLGEEHPATLSASGDLASALILRGDVEGAQELQEHVLVVMRRVLGDRDRTTVAAMTNLANTFTSQGDYVRAIELQTEAFEAMTELFGPTHPQTLTVMMNLAGAMGEEGDFDSAEALATTGVRFARSRLGDEHFITLNMIVTLATALARKKRPKEAAILFEEVLDIRRRRLGQFHPHTTMAAWGLFTTLFEMKIKDAKRIRIVITRDLQWLLSQAPESLPKEQRIIRQQLAPFAERHRFRWKMMGGA